MNLFGAKPTFLYPHSRQFPFDEVCERIVKALEARNWHVPNVKVKFDTYGKGQAKFTIVREISGQGFRLSFCRVQNLIPNTGYNDTAAVNTINIPGDEIHVYEDESGPTYYVYVGKDWKKDEAAFVHGSKVNSKLNNKPRIYLRYTGSEDTKRKYHYQGRRTKYLVHDDDLGREYSPQGLEKPFFYTQGIMEMFKQWLEKNVLEYILKYPEQKPAKKAAKQPPPFPSGFPLFTFGKYGDFSRITQGKKDPNKLPAEERFGLIGSGKRLLPLTIPDNGKVKKIAYEGFCWCAIGKVDKNTDPKTLPKEIGREYRWDDDKYLIRVTPKHADGIYIADYGAAEKFRNQWFQDHPNAKQMSDDAYREYERMPGYSIRPINEYKGGFIQPLVLINRELEFDEVEIVYEIR